MVGIVYVLFSIIFFILYLVNKKNKTLKSTIMNIGWAIIWPISIILVIVID